MVLGACRGCVSSLCSPGSEGCARTVPDPPHLFCRGTFHGPWSPLVSCSYPVVSASLSASALSQQNGLRHRIRTLLRRGGGARCHADGLGGPDRGYRGSLDYRVCGRDPAGRGRAPEQTRGGASAIGIRRFEFRPRPPAATTDGYESFALEGRAREGLNWQGVAIG